MTTELTVDISVTDREAQILSDAIRFIWKSGAVTDRSGAVELMSLEDRIVEAIKSVKDSAYGPTSKIEGGS